MPPIDDPTAVTWWRCSGDKIYHLNPQTFFTHRHYHAVAIRPMPFYHRNIFFSRVTGEQIRYEVVQKV